MITMLKTITGFVFLAFFISFSQANDKRPDIELVGAIAGTSADGSVAAWEGGLSAGLKKVSGHHVDPFKSESPLFVIDATNYEAHKEKLTPGLIALLKTYPETFKIPVYPSHRTAAYPEWMYENMRTAVPAQLTDNGNGIRNPVKGVSFPNPQSGLEAIWNHLARWRGHYYKRSMAEATVYENGAIKLAKTLQDVSFELFRHHKQDLDEENPVLIYYSSYLTYPPRLAGGALLLIDYINQHKSPRKVWSYDADQRRVKRLPSIEYDNEAILSDGLRTADETDMYNGAPDRYNWELLGRAIKYIPYNNYRLSSPELKYEDILTPHHLASQHTRFEAHRVWVIKATLKEDAYHIYKTRLFYLDEDTWSIAEADQYDQKERLWRVSLAFTKQFYEVPLMFTAVAVFHDLKSRNYNAHGMTNEEINTGEYFDEYPSPSYFRPSSLKTKARK